MKEQISEELAKEKEKGYIKLSREEEIKKEKELFDKKKLKEKLKLCKVSEKHTIFLVNQMENIDEGEGKAGQQEFDELYETTAPIK